MSLANQNYFSRTNKVTSDSKQFVLKQSFLCICTNACLVIIDDALIKLCFFVLIEFVI